MRPTPKNPARIDGRNVGSEFNSLWSPYHLVPDESLTSYTIELCCENAKSLLRTRLSNLDVAVLWSLFDQSKENQETLRGIRFEAYAHEKILVHGFNVTATRLHTTSGLSYNNTIGHSRPLSYIVTKPILLFFDHGAKYVPICGAGNIIKLMEDSVGGHPSSFERRHTPARTSKNPCQNHHKYKSLLPHVPPLLTLYRRLVGSRHANFNRLALKGGLVQVFDDLVDRRVVQVATGPDPDDGVHLLAASLQIDLRNGTVPGDALTEQVHDVVVRRKAGQIAHKEGRRAAVVTHDAMVVVFRRGRERRPKVNRRGKPNAPSRQFLLLWLQSRCVLRAAATVPFDKTAQCTQRPKKERGLFARGEKIPGKIGRTSFDRRQQNRSHLLSATDPWLYRGDGREVIPSRPFHC